MEQPQYEVPANATGGGVRELTHAEAEALEARAHTLQDVVVVAALLSKVPKFPLDVINNVLLFADFLVTFEATTQEQRHGESNMNAMYLELRLPAARELEQLLPPGVTVALRCVELAVNCASHDQGWASTDNEHNGTYNASYTWTEVAVVKQDEDSEPVEVARQPVTSNVRADRTTRHHVKLFKDRDGLTSHIALGDTVQLILRSQYPGWGNWASYGRLRARFALEVEEDAQFALVQVAELLAREADWIARFTGGAGDCVIH